MDAQISNPVSAELLFFVLRFIRIEQRSHSFNDPLLVGTIPNDDADTDFVWKGIKRVITLGEEFLN